MREFCREVFFACLLAAAVLLTEPQNPEEQA